jgi:glycosyltransferase involved in cell wall biosynthesis
MKVSIVMPVHNEEKYIKSCLDSLMRQSEKADEIIIVDNNSTDDTVSIATQFKGVRIIREKQKGITVTRNKGFNNAKYEIIARCDADSILPSNWIKKIKEVFSSDKKIVGFTNSVVFYDLPAVPQTSLPSDIFYYFSKAIIGIPALIGSSLAITRKVWLEVKEELCTDDKKVHEDIDLAIHISKYGKISFEPEVIVKISGRRIKYNPTSFFIEYPLRLIKMLKSHRHLI